MKTVKFTKKVNWNGTAGNDSIIISGGKKSVIKTKKGNDTVKMTGGSYGVVYGNEGNDTISVGAKVLGATVFGGAGKDRITINSTKSYKSKYKGVYDGKSYTQISYNGTYVDAGSGNDIIVVNTGVGHTIYGGKGNDTITVGKKAQAYVDAGAGNDIITIKSATQNKYIYNGETRYSSTQVTAGSGNDTITITAGKGHTIFTGSGKDTVEIKGGKNGTVTYGSGNNEFTVTGGSGYKFKSEYFFDGKEYNPDNYYSKSTKWKSTVTISGGSNNSLDLGNGDDKVMIKGGKSNSVNVRDGNDYIEVTGGTNSVVSMNSDEYGKDIGKAKVYIKGGTGTSVYDGHYQGGRVYVQGGSFKRINVNGGNVSLSSKVKYGKTASYLDGGSGNGAYKIAWKDTINLLIELRGPSSNQGTINKQLTISGIDSKDITVTESGGIKDGSFKYTITGKNGGKIVIKPDDGKAMFNSVTIGNKMYSSLDEVSFGMLSFSSSTVDSLENNSINETYIQGVQSPYITANTTIK